jgi:transposase
MRQRTKRPRFGQRRAQRVEARGVGEPVLLDGAADQRTSAACSASVRSTAHIGAVAERIRLVNQQLKTAHRKLDELWARLEQPAESEPGHKSEQRDVAILRSFPGIGRINLATLLPETWQPLERREYSVLRAMSGVAPVTRSSGKACIDMRRLACNKRMESALTR